MEENMNVSTVEVKTKFCKHCGAKIPEDAVLCTSCGRQVEALGQNSGQPQIVINNANNNSNTNTNVNGGMPYRKICNKWQVVIRIS